MKKLLFALFTLLTLVTQAQVKVGNNPTSINASAVLEAESTTQGFLPPRMTTAQRDAISNPTVGLMIYNTDTKCTETFLGVGATGTSTTGWKNLCKSNINATFSAGTLNCSAGSLVGDYVATVGMTAANYKVVTVTVLSAGDYSASSDEVNGVKFSADGTIQSQGTSVQLNLYASGTPVGSGTFTYTVTLSGQTCQFTVTYANPPATLQNGTVNCSGTAVGNYIAGNVMVSGTNTTAVSVTPTSIGYSNLSTNTVNGITFSGTSTFTAGDVNNVKNITLNASGTALAAGTFTYTVSGTGVTVPCTFTVTFTSQLQYASAQINTMASPVTIGTKMSFSNVNANGIAISGTSITLRAGKTYKLTAILRGYGGDWSTYGFTNSSGTDLAGSSRGISYPDYGQSCLPAMCVYTVGSSDENIELRKLDGSNSFGVITNADGSSSLIVEEIPSGRDYLLARGNNTSGSAISSNLDVTWSAVKNNGITVSGSNITLAANKRYLVRSYLRVGQTAASDWVEHNIVNSSNVAIGSSTGLWLGITNSINSPTPAQAIITTGASAQVIKVRTNISGNPTYINSDAASEVEIIELPTDASYAAMAAQTAVGNQSVSVPGDISLATQSVSAGGLVTSGSSFTLKAGKTYRITTSLRKTGNNYIGFAYVNNANAVLSNVLYGFAYGTGQGNLPAEIIYKTGSSDETIKVRATSGAATTVGAGNSGILVYELR